jgi:hypothetical protein
MQPIQTIIGAYHISLKSNTRVAILRVTCRDTGRCVTFTFGLRHEAKARLAYDKAVVHVFGLHALGRC